MEAADQNPIPLSRLQAYEVTPEDAVQIFHYSHVIDLL